jgi:hypothetical protein
MAEPITNEPVVAGAVKLKGGWGDVATSDIYRGSDDKQKKAIQDNYFNVMVKPRVERGQLDVNMAREAFNEEIKKPLPAHFDMAVADVEQQEGVPISAWGAAGKNIMKEMESVIPSFAKAGGEFLSEGVTQATSKALMASFGFGSQKMLEKVIGASDPIKEYKEAVNPTVEQLRNFSENYQYLSPSLTPEEAQLFGTKFSGASASMAKNIGYALATKGKGLPVMAAEMFGRSYLQAENENPEWSREKKFDYAFAQAGCEAILEQYGTTQVLKGVEKIGSTTLKEYLKKGQLFGIFKKSMTNFVTEGAQEASQQVANNAIDQVYQIDRGIFDGMVEAAFIGGLAGGAFGGSTQAFVNMQIDTKYKAALKANNMSDAEIQEIKDSLVKVINDSVELSPEGLAEGLKAVKDSQILEPTTDTAKKLTGVLKDYGSSYNEINEVVNTTTRQQQEDMINEIQSQTAEEVNVARETIEQQEAYTERFEGMKSMLDIAGVEDAEANAALWDAMINATAVKVDKTRAEVFDDVVPTVRGATELIPEAEIDAYLADKVPNIKDLSEIEMLKEREAAIEVLSQEKLFQEPKLIDRMNAILEEEGIDYRITKKDKSIETIKNEQAKEVVRSNIKPLFQDRKSSMFEEVYHGTYKGNPISFFDNKLMQEGNTGKGIYLTTDKQAAGYYSVIADEAKQLADVVEDKDFNREIIRKKGDILKVSIDESVSIKEFEKQPSEDQLKDAKENGYDGVSYPDSIIQKAEDFSRKILGEFNAHSAQTVMMFDSEGIDIEGALYQDKRGAFTPRLNLIELFKDADKSTFLHESAHAFFSYYLKEMPSELAPVMTWAGYKGKNYTDLNANQQLEVQEKFARGFEAYLREGKAPNRSLSDTFRKFKTWLEDIYKSIRDLKINLSNDIRKFYDNMLEIESYRPIEMTGEQEIGDLKLFQEELAEEYKKTKKDVKRLEKEIRKLEKEQKTSEIKQLEKEMAKVEEAFKDKAISQIKRQLKTTKELTGTAIKKGKYDYESNKYFERLREYNKMTKDEAFNALFALEPTTPQELMEKRFLEYVARGKKYGSISLYEQVLRDLLDAKQIGKQAKNEQEFLRRLNRAEKASVIEAGIQDIKGTKDSLKNKVLKSYAKGFGSVYSLLNVMGGRKVAEQFDPEIYENRYNTAVFKKTKQVTKEAAEAFELDNPRDLSTVVNNMATDPVNKYEITDNDGITKEISKMELVDIYNSIKNDQIRERYYNTFGEAQITNLLSNLSAQEKRFGDVLQQNLTDYYSDLSQIYVKLYGRDLSKVKQYWPSTSEHQSEIDIFNDYIGVGITPSSFKERVKGMVEPKPVNAWYKAMRHVSQSEHIMNLGLEYKTLKDIFADKRVKDAVEKKFGKDMLDLFNKQLDRLSLNSQSEKLDAVSGLFGKMLNNWVVAKIGVPNPGVPLKQLISIGNYMEVMPAGEWSKNFAEGVLNPKKTMDFMLKNADFLEARFGRGSTEAINRAMDEAGRMSKAKQNWTQYMTLLTRAGDITAIIYGGYPVVKYHMDQGKTIEQAVEIFEKATLKAQQSGNASALSDFQNSQTPLTKLFLAFKNTPTQYLRKLVEANMEVMRGDITPGQYAKTMAIYAVIQPALFGFMGTLSRSLFFGKEEEKEDYMEDMMDALILNPFNAIPIIDGMSRWTLRKLTERKPYEAFQFPVFSDLQQAFRKLNKKDIEAFDVLSVIAKPVGELGAAIPVGTLERLYKGWLD